MGSGVDSVWQSVWVWWWLLASSPVVRVHLPLFMKLLEDLWLLSSVRRICVEADVGGQRKPLSALAAFQVPTAQNNMLKWHFLGWHILLPFKIFVQVFTKIMITHPENQPVLIFLLYTECFDLIKNWILFFISELMFLGIVWVQFGRLGESILYVWRNCNLEGRQSLFQRLWVTQETLSLLVTALRALAPAYL